MSALPPPYVAVVLVLASYRITRLLGWDAFPPIAKLRDRLLKKRTGRGDDGRQTVAFGRPTLAQGWECPYCQGFWTGLVVWAAWLVLPTVVLVACIPFALNALVGIISRNLD